MAFTNTVETVGDAALTRSIIDRSITELNDNISVSIRQQAFRACSALASVNFPNVTSVGLGAFWQCTALTKADFASCVTFANNAFYGCTALTALILRCTDQLCTITGTPFAGSAIASGTGYIYVPAVLVDQYKASWTAYAGQVRAIEDYPEVCDPYSWAAVAKAIDNGTYASVYKVGDLIPLDMGSEGQFNMQIVAFDADDLADGSGKAHISWIGVRLLATLYHMNSTGPQSTTADDGSIVYTEGTGTIGGWEKCEMRTYLNNTILPMIPAETRAMIKPVTKRSYIIDATGVKSENVETVDSVWIPSYREMFGGTKCETVDPVYDEIFSTAANRKKYQYRDGTTAIINRWWLRSAESNNKYSFCAVGTSGTLDSNSATYTYGIALGFCT